MERNLKVVLIVLVILGAVGSVVLFGTLQQTQQQLQRSQQDVAQLTSENEALGQQLTELQNDRRALEERFNSLRNQLSSATTELERSRSRLEELQAQYNQFAEERNQLQAQVASMASERDEANSRIAQLEEEKSDLKRAATRFRERLKLLERDHQRVAEELDQIRRSPNSSLRVITDVDPLRAANNPSGTPALSGAVELPPIVVNRSSGAAAPAGSLRGRLVDVNEAQRFVVVDKGSDDGVRVGMSFDILRGSAMIGRATVVRVRPKFSACDLSPSLSTGSTQVGDLAVQIGS